MKINFPAFPVPDTADGGPSQTQMLGMWMRDYFAAAVMPSLVAWTLEGGGAFTAGSDVRIAALAETAYRLADALMEARKS